jgi:hypothetical protein
MLLHALHALAVQWYGSRDDVQLQQLTRVARTDARNGNHADNSAQL